MKNAKEYITTNSGSTLWKVSAPKQRKGIINNYIYSISSKGLRTLNNCYSKPSINKQTAYSNCCKLCLDLHGWDLTITGFNCDKFTVMFEFVHPVNGNVCLAYITKEHNRYVEE